MTIIRNILLALVAVGGLLAPVQSALAQDERWVFRVLLDDREIGFHEFRVQGSPGERQVEINAQFDVKILFFNAYSYDHQNTEVWQGNCLTGLDAVTNDNGDEYVVSGETVSDGFMVNINTDSSRIGSDCVRTFAYWNPAILNSRNLLNSQTGEIVEVEIRDEGSDTLEIGANRIPAQKYTLVMEDGPISLWYGPDRKRWLALEAPAKGGRVIRYEPVILPGGTDADSRLAMD